MASTKPPPPPYLSPVLHLLISSFYILLPSIFLFIHPSIHPTLPFPSLYMWVDVCTHAGRHMRTHTFRHTWALEHDRRLSSSSSLLLLLQQPSSLTHSLSQSAADNESDSSPERR
eukprot:GHVU01175911.1.p4 GENE.GHVU01175911.1~~GHVU01175911.1.p4  ORF type:complete len:115 (-),score=11.98 GHVU01175911.1:796-1140(-)